MMEFSLSPIQIFVSTFLKLIFVFFNQMQIIFVSNFSPIKKMVQFILLMLKKVEHIHSNFINPVLEVKIFKKYKMASQEQQF